MMSLFSSMVRRPRTTVLSRVIGVTCAMMFSMFACSVGAHAQVVSASLSGTVQDPTGAAVPGAQVDVLNTSTGVAAHGVTEANGRYTFPSLAPGGPYTVTVAAKGFAMTKQTGITLTVNQVAELPLTLNLGASDQTVEVHADVSLLDTESSSEGQLISNRSIVNLPLNQRNPYALIFLVPGVTGSVSNQYNSSNISVNGGRPGSTDVLIDGIPSSPPLIVPIAGFGAFPSVDAVQEFKVETNAYSPEFGRSGSGVINLITKSGTNRVHGSAYEFARNSYFDANTYFANRSHTPLPAFSRNQFGGSFGGPVVIPHLYHGKDRTFFFFSYEGLRQGTFSQTTTTVPTALQRAGDFSQTYNSSGQPVVIYDPTTTVSNGSGGYTRSPFPNNMIPSNRFDKVAVNALKYYPLPNQAGTVTGANNYFASGVSKINTDTYDAKVDEVLNDRNRMFVRYSRRNLNQPPVYIFPDAVKIAGGGSSQAQISNSLAIDYSHTTKANLVSELRYGFARTSLNIVAISAGFDPTSLGFPGYITANADHLLFPGFAPANYFTLGDSGQGAEKKSGFEIHTVGMNNTLVKGNHLLKAGFDIRFLRVNNEESGQSTGLYNFTQAITQGPNPNVATSTAGNSIASMLLGVGSSGSIVLQSRNAATFSHYFGFYAGDDWKITSRLTVNLGLRYDFDVPRTERHNRMETFDPNAPSPLRTQTGLAQLSGGPVFVGVNGLSRNQYSTRLTDISPRLGAAYQIDRNTSIRAAYGIFFGPSYRTAAGTVGNAGFSATTTYVGSADGLTPSTYISNPFPNGLNPIVGSAAGVNTGIGSDLESPLRYDNRVPYTQNYHVSLERQLPWDLLVDAAYVGSHGVHINRDNENAWNANQLSPDVLAQGTALQTKVTNPFYGIILTGPEANATIARSYLLAPFPQYTSVLLSYLTGGFVSYNSFQLKVQKRFTHDISFLASFTGQKQMDDYSGIQNVGNIQGGIQNIYNPRGERAVSSNDISRNLVISGTATLPFGHGQRFGSHWNGLTDALLGGWQVNGITTQQTGFPLAPTTQNTSQSGSNVLRPNLTGTSPVTSGGAHARITGWINPAAFSQPAAFTFGNSPRTITAVRAMGVHNVDFSVFKNFRPADKFDLQFRAEAYNILNQVQFGQPNMTLSSGQFGVVSSQANSPRQLQLAVKALF